MQLSYVVAGGGNTSGVVCDVTPASGFCVSILFLLQDAALVDGFNTTLASWVRLNSSRTAVRWSVPMSCRFWSSREPVAAVPWHRIAQLHKCRLLGFR